MADTPYMSEIKIFSFNFAPKTWALCNGQFLPINQNQALFSLLGTTYGGNGTTIFALPDLRGRVPMNHGSINGLPTYSQGQASGEHQNTLTVQEIPIHTHQAIAKSGNPNAITPSGNFWPSNTGFTPYGTRAQNDNTLMATDALGSAGGSQPHENMSPFLALNYCIALTGIFP